MRFKLFPPKKPFREEAEGVIITFGLLGAALSVATFFSSYVFFDIFTSFRPQFAIGCLLCFVLCLVLARFRWSIVFLLVALVNLYPLLPYLSGQAMTGSGQFKAISFNVYTENTRYPDVESFLLKEDADFVVLLEVNQDWLDGLSKLKAVYPHVVSKPREDNFGIALLSKFPLLEPRMLVLSEYPVPVVSAGISFPGNKTIRILGIHTMPPAGEVSFAERNLLLDNAALTLSEVSGPKMLLGDFNITPWSPLFSRLLEKSGLQDPAIGQGMQFTFPIAKDDIPQFLFDIISLRLDYILGSREIDFTSLRTGPVLGSDHLPVIAEFSFRELSQ
jgi:endonuclease/exonuclease/phosphatase (EEP) superfamily protein YafD